MSLTLYVSSIIVKRVKRVKRVMFSTIYSAHAEHCCGLTIKPV
jgi:hypothetical protein